MEAEKASRVEWQEAAWQMQLGTGIFFWDSNTINGLSPTNSGINSWYEIIHSDDRLLVRQALEEAISGNRTTFTMEYRLLANETEHRIFNKGIILYENGKADRIINTLTSMSSACAAQEAEKNSRQTLLETQQKLLTLVDNSVDLMSILELDGKNSYLNKAGMELLGFENRQQVIDTPIEQLHSPEDFEQVRQEVLPSVMVHGRWSGTMMVRHIKTGEIFPVINNTLRIDDPATGAPIGVGAVMRDLRPEIKAKKDLQESEQRYRILSEELEARVKERTRDLTEANAKLETSNTELEQYAYVASHDLQEPLRKIRIYSDMLNEMQSLPLEAKTLIGKVMKSSERMSQLIRDLLEFSRLMKADKKTRQVDLNGVLHNVITDFELLVREKNAQIERCDLPTVEAVPLQMNQLFYNLISNALKFTQSGLQPKVTITCSSIDAMGAQQLGLDIHDGTYHHIIIADNGIGFNTQYADRIFEVFSRLHADSSYPGSGIGLALCRRIVQNHNGYLKAFSEEGKGTQMHIILPAASL